MRDAAPGHVRDVQQTVDATEIDERAEVGDVLDDALSRLIDLELLHQLLALAGPLVLEDDTTRDDDVAAALVQLDDLELELLAEELVDVRHATERDLRAREERVDAHEVDDHATLDLLDEGALDRLIVLVGETDALPHAHEVRLLLRQDDRAFLVLEVLEQDLDLIADLEVREVLELLERDTALRFEADVEHDHVVADLEDVGFDDLALVDRRHRAVVHLHHCFELVGRVALIVHEFGAQVGKGAQLRTLRVALCASAQRRLVRRNLELSHTGKRSPESRVSARRAEFEETRAIGSNAWMASRAFAERPDWSEPENIRSRSPTVNGADPLSRVRTVGYGASQRDDPLDLLFLRQIGRIEQDCVGGLDSLRGVLGVPLHEQVGLVGDLCIRGASSEPLDQAAAGALPRVRDEEDLQRRIGKYSGPDVAPINDHVVRLGRLAH